MKSYFVSIAVMISAYSTKHYKGNVIWALTPPTTLAAALTHKLQNVSNDIEFAIIWQQMLLQASRQVSQTVWQKYDKLSCIFGELWICFLAEIFLSNLLVEKGRWE